MVEENDYNKNKAKNYTILIKANPLLLLRSAPAAAADPEEGKDIKEEQWVIAKFFSLWSTFNNNKYKCISSNFFFFF